MAARTRLASLLPLLVFMALRTLAHANPLPLPWSSGVFDAQGLDDVLQTIRIAYVKAPDARPVPRELLAIATGCVALAEPSLDRGPVLAAARSRGPPELLGPSG
jgi:hypothetical protein